MLPIDLTGKRALVAGVADDNGFGWAIAKAFAEAGASVCVLDPQGRLLTRFGGGDDPCAPGDFYAPHDLCLDSHGDLYVGEVAWSAGGRHGLVAASCHVLQKFVRVN